MTDSPLIPGTRVPDHAIHRASMWLEDVKFAERRPDVEQIEQITDNDALWWIFIQETGLPVTVEQLKESAHYYGLNMLRMTLGNRVNVLMPAPDGKGLIDLTTIFTSLWLDAFQHGVATAQGKRGLSNTEMRDESRRA